MADLSAGDQGKRPILLALRFPLTSILCAFRFLTILPISWRSERDGDFFQASLLWFPLVGLLMGAGAALPLFFSVSLFPQPVSAVLAMLLLAGISGCLHLDGLADSGDGLLSARSRERALEIMRDSRSGAMGVIALIFVLLGKYAALSSLSPGNLISVVILMPLAGRSAILMSMAVLPYARSGGGLGQLFYSGDAWLLCGTGLLLCAAASSLLLSLAAAFLYILAILVTVALFSFWCRRKLGGATGDTLGAVCELTELAAALTLLPLLSGP